MKSAKNFLMVAGAFALAVTMFAILAPKTAQAFVATLVQVTNTSANPVPNQAVDAMSLHPMVLRGFVGIANGSQSNSANLENGSSDFVVPAGKRFIFDTISVHAELPVGEALESTGVVSVQSHTDSNSYSNYYYLNPSPTAQAFGFQYSTVTQKVMTYSDAGFTIGIFANRGSSTSGSTIVEFTVTGYLLDCPGGVCPLQ
jgi:hypothetical protein